MVEESTQEWFLEIDGKRTGPFDTEQVLGLLADGEIPDTTQVYASTTTAEFVTARELADRERDSRERDDGPTGKIFVPPPRPTEIPAGSETARSSAPISKPELGLVDALLAAKERKINSTRAMPPEMARRSPNPFQLQNIPRKAWAILATAAVLFIGIWGMTYFIKQRSATLVSAPAQPETKALPFVPPPAAPAAAAAVAALAHGPVQPATSAGSVTAVTPPPNPAAMMPTGLSQHDTEADRERDADREREKEREREHERDLAANNDSASQPIPPPPLPVNPPGQDIAGPGGLPPGPPGAVGPGGFPAPPVALPEIPPASGFAQPNSDNPPPVPAPPPVE